MIAKKNDPSIRSLVAALNAFPGVATIGSCGGHENPGPGQWAAGKWYVKLIFDQDDDGWLALEFLAWAINNDYRRADHHVILYPTSPPPWLNQPEEMLSFSLEGHDGCSADSLAAFLDRVREDCFSGD